MNAKQATFNVLASMPDGYEFSGFDLKVWSDRRTTAIPSESHYVSTHLRYMREYRQKTGRQIVCVNKKKSLYKIV